MVSTVLEVLYDRFKQATSPLSPNKIIFTALMSNIAFISPTSASKLVSVCCDQLIRQLGCNVRENDDAVLIVRPFLDLLIITVSSLPSVLYSAKLADCVESALDSVTAYILDELVI